MENIIMHCDAVLEMVNGKIEDIHAGYGDELDSGELDDLCKCVKILAKLAKIKCIEHEMRRHASAATVMKHVMEKTM